MKIPNRKSISKSENCKLKVDFKSENFKFKFTKCKIYFHNWKFKSHNWHWAIANSQLRKRSSQPSVSTFTRLRPLPSPPSPYFFSSECVLGRIFPEVRHFFFLTTKNHPRRDRPTGLPLFANVVSLPLEFGSHGKMRLTSLHDCYSSWHFYICRSLVRSLDLFDASLLSVTGGGGGGVLNKVLYGEAPPRGPTPYLFIYYFGRKGTPFIYLLLKKGTPFTYLF